MDRRRVRAAILALRLIFWGGLLVVFDVTIAASSQQFVDGRLVEVDDYRIDVLNDAVGFAMITWALLRLRGAPVGGSYRPVTTFVLAMSVYGLLEGIAELAPLEAPEWWRPVDEALGLAQLVAAILFCAAMRWFCGAASLPDAERSWKATFWAFLLVYGVILGLYRIVVLAAFGRGISFGLDVGVVGLVLVVPVLLVPLVLFFVSTSRMARAARDATA